jgi:hypothetical protein
MCVNEQTTAREVFLVSPSRLAWGEYVGETKKGQGDISASYSADRICEGKPIRKPFQWQGNLWVCISSSGRGLTITREHEFHAYRLILRRLFPGEAISYASRSAAVDGGETAREHPMGFYHGIVVKHGGNELVMCGPEATFMADENELDSEGKRSATPTQLGLF